MKELVSSKRTCFLTKLKSIPKQYKYIMRSALNGVKLKRAGIDARAEENASEKERDA
jgi:hypothetical protein